MNPEKEKLIQEILKYRPEYATNGMDLYSYTKEQLEFHLKKLKEKYPTSPELKEKVVIEKPKEKRRISMQEKESIVGKRGRKAEQGTYEAREYVSSEKFQEWMSSCPVSEEARARIQKAIYFGLGVKTIAI